MLDKELIKKNFKKSLLTYNKNAVVQNKMAQKLFSLLEEKQFKDILEIGSYTGLLTQILCSKIEFDTYFAIDIIDSFEFIKKINPKIDFIKTDIENFKTDKKFDLIVANASLQWCEDFSDVIKKLKSFLKKEGIFAVSIFDENNLFEIRDVFKTGLKYPSKKDIEKLFPNSKIIQENEKLSFKTPLEVLKHLKLTGVNSISINLSYSEIKKRLKVLNEKYNNTLTYTPLYIVYQNI